jgi:hypothetical protein
MYDKIKTLWMQLQDLLSVDGGLYVDAMCLVIIARLIAVLFHCPPLTGSEAGLWGVTIATYGYTTKGPKGS